MKTRYTMAPKVKFDYCEIPDCVEEEEKYEKDEETIKIDWLNDQLFQEENDSSNFESVPGEIDENLLFDSIVSKSPPKIKPNSWPQFIDQVPIQDLVQKQEQTEKPKIDGTKNPIYEKCGRINPRRDCWDKSFTSSCFRPSRKGKQYFLQCGVFTVRGEVRKCPDYTVWNQKILGCDYGNF